MKEIIIKFDNVTKAYQTSDIETTAICKMNLEIYKGEYIAITGPSGGGKSSILSVMGMLDGCSDGTYFFKGADVSLMSKSQKSKVRNTEIGFIFQSFNLIDTLSVFDNVALPLRYRSDISDDELRKRVDGALESVELAHRSGHFPSQLSGGQQQRVAVARAFVIDPSIILADEPTGNLDSKSADIVMQLIREKFESGVTVCMVTHDPRYTSDATRIIYIEDGAIANAKVRAPIGRTEAELV